MNASRPLRGVFLFSSLSFVRDLPSALQPTPSVNARKKEENKTARQRTRSVLLTLFIYAYAWPAFAAAFDVEALLDRHGFARNDVALLVETLDGGAVLAHRADAAGIPASTLKLLTAIGVLERYGSEHRFATRLLLRGDEGAPTVILQGGGDPELDLDGLMRLALAMRAGGLATAGLFLIDDEALPRLATVNPAMPVGDAYNAGFGALNLAFNRVSVLDGAGLRPWTLPPLIEDGPVGIDIREADSLPVRDAGLHTGRMFRELAASLGVVLPPPQRGRALADDREIRRVWSKTTAALVQDMLLYSNNQVAEILGFAATGEPTQTASATKMLSNVAALSSSSAIDAIVATNHSGLTSKASASPRALIDLLRVGNDRHRLLGLLPAAAWSGSLAKSFVEKDKALRVWAKTGSLDYALALAGLTLPRRGSPCLFALLIGDRAMRETVDGIKDIDDVMRRSADAWALRARRLRDAVVTELLR